MPPLREAINTYLDMRTREGDSESILRNSRSILERFLAFTGNVRVEQLEPRDTWLWFHGEPNRAGLLEPHMSRRGKGRMRLVPPVSGQTANKYVDLLSVFFRFALTQGWTQHDLLRDMRKANGTIKRHKVQQRDILFLTPDQMRAIAKVPRWHRDRIMLTVVSVTGVRVSELRRFRLGDLDLSAQEDAPYGTITIRRTKSRDEVEHVDIMALNAELRAALDEWLPEYAGRLRPQFGGPVTVAELLSHKEWFLLPRHLTVPNNHDPERKHMLSGYVPLYTIRHPERVLQAALAAIGYPIPANVWLGMHAIRHSVADHWDTVYGLDMAQEMLGHRDAKTTQGYLRKNKKRDERNRILASMPAPETAGSITHLDQRRVAAQ